MPFHAKNLSRRDDGERAIPTTLGDQVTGRDWHGPGDRGRHGAVVQYTKSCALARERRRLYDAGRRSRAPWCAAFVKLVNH